jgi:hypothetical protein
MGSLALRPDDSLTILTMALSIGYKSSVSLPPAIQATGPLTLTPVGLPPTEHASLCLDTPQIKIYAHRIRRQGKTTRPMSDHLYYGDNLQVLRDHVKDESVDLIYLGICL